jgi:uncharacterized protein YjiS (DUF1127 family)
VICSINCSEQVGAICAGRRLSLVKGNPVMIEEPLHGDDRGYGRRGIARAPDTAWVCAFGIYDPAGQLGAPTPPKLRFTERVPRRAETRGVSPLSAIRRIVSAIRLWRARAHSRQELRELSDHQLSDIGLRREDVGYEFPKPFWYCD